MEKIVKPLSGFLALVISLILFVLGIYLVISGAGNNNPISVIFGVLSFVAFIFFLKRTQVEP